ncbi:MAG: CDP-diacylglycerol--glycerol-3-phosphate 3-phosphatidyltransferase, partial [Paramarteilia canceri]
MEIEEIQCDHNDNELDSILYPILHFGKANVCFIDEFFKEVLTESLNDSDSEIYFTSAYINPSAQLCDKLVSITQERNVLNLILPNPKTNSFYKFSSSNLSFKQGFIKNHIAGMYGLFIKKLVDIFKSTPNAIITEYLPNTSESYHAKGLWIGEKGFMSSKTSNTN